MNTVIIQFESTELRVLDTPDTLTLVHELNHAKRTLETLTFRARLDVMGEENFAAREYERGVARATMNLLRAFAV